jgi:phosphatidate cytidylyltransferase
LTDSAARDGKAPVDPGRELSVRIGSALVLALLALGGAVLGGWAAAVVIAAAAAIVHVEWAGITERAYWPPAAFTAALVIALAVFAAGHPELALAIAAVSILVAAATSRSIWRAAGIFYAAILGFGLIAIRLSEPLGLVGILFVFAVVWATDTGAFFVGRGLGGARLWPRVSPNKTWSGAIGGIVAGVAAGLVVVAVARLPVTPMSALVAGALAVAAEAGDLFESALKRTFGTKDAGRLIPGHGGLMDRVDGLLAAAGIGALVGFAHAGASVGQGLVAW